MKAGWTNKPLGDVCEFSRGLTYAKGDEVDISSNVVLRATNIDLETHLLDLSELKYINDQISIPATKKIKKNSLLICTASGSKRHLGKVALIDDEYDYAFGGFMGMLSPRREVASKFLFYLMTSDRYRDFIADLSDGANINNLKFSDLQHFKVPVPPPSEQQRIVTILDEAFAGIATARAAAEQNRLNARAAFESQLQFVFFEERLRWKSKPLADFCEKTRVITYGVVKLGDECSGGTPCLRTSNVRRLYIDQKGIKRISPSLSDSYSRTVLRGGEVLVNVRGTLGGVALATVDMAGWNVSREVAVIPVDSQKIDPTYLSYLIASGVSQDWLSAVKKGAAYVGINIEDLRRLPVHAPTLERQAAIVGRVGALHTETQRLESLYQRKLTALDELKQSILHQAFSGAL